MREGHPDRLAVPPSSPEPEEPALDPEWEDAFAWSYGRRLWNVGCG